MSGTTIYYNNFILNKEKSFFLTCIFCLCIVSSVFQASAFINFDSFSLSVPAFFQVLATVFFLACVLLSKSLVVRKKIFIVWLFFFIICIFSAILPFIFSGTSVLNPRLGIDYEIFHPSKLHFTISNAGQIIYLCLNSILFIFCISNKIFNKEKLIHRAFIYSGWIVCFFAYYQYASKIFNIPYPDSILYSSQHYSQGFQQMLGGMQRVNSTFVEPSLAAGCLISYFTYYFFKSIYKRAYIIPAVLFFFAAIITTSSTIIAGIIVAFIALLFLEKRFLMVCFFILVLGLMATLFYNYVDLILIHKMSSLSGIHRSLSNIFSIDVLLNTYGLGAGLGSNRPSSFLLYLLSNIGIIGTISFFCIIAIPWRIFYKNYRTLGSTKKALFIAFNSYLFCKLVALPDLNDNFFWVFLCLLIISSQSINETNSRI